MKFTCRQSILGETLGALVKIPYPKTNLEVLRGTLFEVKDGTLTFFRTNLDTLLKRSVPVKNSEDGVVVVDTSKVTQYIQTLDSKEDITCELIEGGFVISSGQNKVTLSTLESEEFPIPQNVTPDSEVTIDVGILNKGLQSTVFACAKSAIRPEFASVYVYQKKETKELCFVATDSFRLSEFTEGYEFNEFRDFLIPAPVAQNLLKVTQGFEGDVSLGYGDGQLILQKDGYTIISRLTDAEYPAYQKIIPQDFQYQIQVFKKDLIAIFRQVQIFSDVYNKVVLSISKDSLKLTSGNQQGEGGDHHIPATLSKLEDDAEEAIEFKFNYAYFLEALQHVPGETVSLFVPIYNREGGRRGPLVIKDDQDKNYLALIMPMSK